MYQVLWKFSVIVGSFFIFVALGIPVENFQDIDDKVIGGEDARTPGIFPYQVSLQHYQEVIKDGKVFAKMSKFCGGTIIAKNVVLTAAHCINQTNPSFMKTFHVNAGIVKAFCYDGTSQLIKVKEAIVHPDWDPVKITNDVAILVLEKPFEYNFAVNYAQLPTEDYQAFGHGIISGWGYTGDLDKDKCYNLQYAIVPVTGYVFCQARYWANLNKDNICVGRPETAASSCAGDSGGPLAVNYNETHPTVVGICSFGGKECAKLPSAYVRISYHLDWIHNILRKKAIY